MTREQRHRTQPSINYKPFASTIPKLMYLHQISSPIANISLMRTSHSAPMHIYPGFLNIYVIFLYKTVYNSMNTTYTKNAACFPQAASSTISLLIGINITYYL